MNRIILIIPYFGKFNNYFNLWLESAKRNENIDFLIVTDNPNPQELTGNIIWKEYSFEEIVARIKNIIQEFSPSISNPYKLCEYKPLYGKLFREYTSVYEFWGYCDIDLIFGDCGTFFCEEILNKYDKFFNRGHLTIFRNNNFFVNLYKYEDCRMPVTYKEAWTTNYCCHFDEMPIWDTIIEENGYRCYNEVDFADINIRSFRFQLAMGNESIGAKQIFQKKGKKLYRLYINDRLKCKEILYVHLQKRTMEVETDSRSENYFIVPNRFIEYIESYPIDKLIEDNSRDKFWKEYYDRRIKEIIKNLQNGALKMRWIRYKRRVACDEYYEG